MAALGEHSTRADWMGAREAAGTLGSEAPGRGHRGPPKAKHGQSGMLTVSPLYTSMLKCENCKIYLISVIEKKLCFSGKTMSTLIRLDRKGNCKLKILCKIILWE